MIDKKVSFIKLDVLKEIGTIGAGRAATSLAELMGSQVDITVPDARLYPFQSLVEMLGKKDSKYYLLHAALSGDICGNEYFLISPDEARTLSSLLLGLPSDGVDLKDEMVLSSLREVANILLSSYMNALSELTDFTVMVGVPDIAAELSLEQLDALISKNVNAPHEILYVKSHLEAKNRNFDGMVMFVPDTASIDKIFARLGLS